MRWLRLSFILSLPFLVVGLIGWQKGGVCDDAGISFLGKNIALINSSFTGGAVSGLAQYNDYRTNQVNDNVYTMFMYIPRELYANSIKIDSINIRIYTQGIEDSVHIYFRRCRDATWTEIDSVWYGGGATGWGFANPLANGSYTVEDNYGYGFHFDCVNNGTADIRFQFMKRVIYSIL